jgi:hypothetical protein
MTFRVTLPRPAAETLVAESVRRELSSVGTLVEQILEQAAVSVKKRAG